jgi:hypothetical protein
LRLLSNNEFCLGSGFRSRFYKASAELFKLERDL